MSRTHVFLRCMHPKLEGACKDIWDRPDEDEKMSNFFRPALEEIKVGEAVSRLDNGNRGWFGWSRYARQGGGKDREK
jgi:hypothetical protein